MNVRVIAGDCLQVLPALAAEGVLADACVCDPPYGLGFMGKTWDSPDKSGDFPSRRTAALDAVNAGMSRQGGRQRACADYTKRQLRDMRSFQRWCEEWAGLVFSLLKPGAHLIAFGGTRTYHRMACAIEDAGFEIRDQIGWLYGSGFPKSHNVGNGWGTALKPAWEPIVLARKPLIGTVAANVLEHGTGALNIDGCRVVTESARPLRDARNYRNLSSNGIYGDGLNGSRAIGETTQGRWPANVIHDGSEEVLAAFPGEAGAAAPVRGTEPSNAVCNVYNQRTRVATHFHSDSGSAARFFYSAKADSDDRLGSKHPTVKPVDLMAYLCRLVTPPGGLVLDPFAGSGTTGMACMREGFRAILIEREAEYVADIHRRLAHVKGEDTPLFAQEPALPLEGAA